MCERYALASYSHRRNCSRGIEVTGQMGDWGDKRVGVMGMGERESPEALRPMAVPVDNPGASGPGVCTDSANGTQGDAPYVSNRLRNRHLTSPFIINIQLTTSFLSVPPI